MPLFTITMKSNGSTSEKDRLSRALHAASIAAGKIPDRPGGIYCWTTGSSHALKIPDA